MGEELHKKAEDAREKGEFLEALKLCDAATLEYQKEGNIVKLAEIQSSRALTLRHLAEQTGDRKFLILAKFAAKSAVKIIEESGVIEGLGTAYYTFGKCKESLGKFEKAKESYEKALENSEGSKDSVIAEMKTRLAAIEYRLGDDSAIERFETALKDLATAKEDSYNKNVWLSGAYMHMAESLITREQKDKAAVYINKAKEIIDSDDRLKLRSGQLEKLKAKLS